VTKSTTNVLRGVAAVQDAINCIGDPDKKDSDIAKLICDNELVIRELLEFALKQAVKKWPPKKTS
jgi:hypothetical protein